MKSKLKRNYNKFQKIKNLTMDIEKKYKQVDQYTVY